MATRDLLYTILISASTDLHAVVKLIHLMITHLHLCLCKQIAHAHAQVATKGQERPSLLAFFRQPTLRAEAVLGSACPSLLPTSHRT